MGSISEKVRIRQKDQAETAVKARIDALTAAGVVDKAQAKDPKLRAAKAELVKAKKRITAIAARLAEVEAAKEKKAKAKKAKKSGGAKKGAKKGGKKGGGKDKGKAQKAPKAKKAPKA